MTPMNIDQVRHRYEIESVRMWHWIALLLVNYIATLVATFVITHDRFAMITLWTLYVVFFIGALRRLLVWDNWRRSLKWFIELEANKPSHPSDERNPMAKFHLNHGDKSKAQEDLEAKKKDIENDPTIAVAPQVHEADEENMPKDGSHYHSGIDPSVNVDAESGEPTVEGTLPGV